MVVFLLMQTWFPSSTDSVDSGNWVNFLECKKFCGIKFALSKDMLQCSENILIGHSWFSETKSTHFPVLQQAGDVNILLCAICSEKPIEMFPDVFLFTKSWKPRPKIEIPKVWGGVLVFPSPRQYIMCGYTRTYVSWGGGEGGGEGLKASCSPVFQLWFE